MLCGIITSTNQKVVARQVSKEHGTFHCAGCGNELIVKKGNIKIHHFSHKPPFNCSRGEGETEAHRKCKETIYFELTKLNNVSNLDMEKVFGSVVADVFCEIDGVPVAIEVQRSNISVNQIVHRTQEYEKIGVNVLWVALFDEKLHDEKYSPTAWMKWCHAAYFGRVFYWTEGLNLLPIHYGEYRLDVPETTWYETGGVERSEGGYTKSSKRYKIPSFGSIHNIANDFRHAVKKRWSGGTIVTPKCRLYVSKYKKWW